MTTGPTPADRDAAAGAADATAGDVSAALDRTVAALRTVNIHAKRYAALAERHYRNGRGAAARRNSLRKEAAFAVKREVLATLAAAGAAGVVAVHDIAGRDREFVCVDVAGRHQFHVPRGEWATAAPPGAAGADADGAPDLPAPTTVEDFSPTADADEAPLTLRAALEHARDAHGVNANDHLAETHVDYGHRSYFAGWDYL